MKKKVLGGLLSIVLVLCCIMSSVSVASAASKTTYSPKALGEDVALTNPYMGWVPNAKEYGSITQDVTLVYVPILWKDLQPKSADDFAWDTIRKTYHFSDWEKQGVKFVIRFYMDDPVSSSKEIKSKHMDIPAWLDKEIGHAGTEYYFNNGGTYWEGFSPDYNNKKLQSYHDKVIKKLYNQLKDDSNVAFIEIGSIGHWGEYHTWPHKSETGVDIYNKEGNTGIFPEDAVANKYLDSYTSRFSTSMLNMRYPNSYARDKKMGLFNDMFGDVASWEEDWGQKKKLENTKMNDFWKYASSGGEFANGDSKKYLNKSNIDVCISQAKEGHVSWLGPCTPAKIKKNDSTYQKYVDKLLAKMGYRFRIGKVEFNNTMKADSENEIVMKWYNDGVAPFYYNWSVKIGLANSEGVVTYSTFDNVDIRKWLPTSDAEGKNGYEIKGKLKVPAEVADGKYTLVTCISDPSTHEPGVNLAIEGKIDSSKKYDWYNVGSVTVSTKIAKEEKPVAATTETPVTAAPASTSDDPDFGIDWSNIKSSVSSSSQDAKSIKVYQDSENVYIRVEGNNFEELSQLYIDSDGTKKTGFKDKTYWPNTGLNILVEAGCWYRHDAADSKWAWTEQESDDIQAVYYADHVEYKIDKSLLGSMINIGFKDVKKTKKDREVVCTLPKKGNYLYIPINK